jgi:hypothetical protein
VVCTKGLPVPAAQFWPYGIGARVNVVSIVPDSVKLFMSIFILGLFFIFYYNRYFIVSALYVSVAPANDRISFRANVVFCLLAVLGLVDRFVSVFSLNKPQFGVFILPVVSSDIIYLTICLFVKDYLFSCLCASLFMCGVCVLHLTGPR